MSAAQFTPGPWFASPFSSIVGIAVSAQPDKTKNTFNVCGVRAPISREENEANARLIASAPELFTTTAAWFEYLDADGEVGDAHLEGRLLEAMRAAVRKARGGQ